MNGQDKPDAGRVSNGQHQQEMAHQAVLAAIAQLTQVVSMLAQTMVAPKRVVRDQNGRVSHIEMIQGQ